MTKAECSQDGVVLGRARMRIWEVMASLVKEAASERDLANRDLAGRGQEAKGPQQQSSPGVGIIGWHAKWYSPLCPVVWPGIRGPSGMG